MKTQRKIRVTGRPQPAGHVRQRMPERVRGGVTSGRTGASEIASPIHRPGGTEEGSHRNMIFEFKAVDHLGNPATTLRGATASGHAS